MATNMRAHEAGTLHADGYGAAPHWLPYPNDVMELLPQLWSSGVTRGGDGVLAVAELLRRQPLNTAAQAHVQTIVDSSETLLRILQDALDLSKAEAGELELSMPAEIGPGARERYDRRDAEAAAAATQQNWETLTLLDGSSEPG